MLYNLYDVWHAASVKWKLRQWKDNVTMCDEIAEFWMLLSYTTSSKKYEYFLISSISRYVLDYYSERRREVVVSAIIEW